MPGFDRFYRLFKQEEFLLLLVVRQAFSPSSEQETAFKQLAQKPLRWDRFVSLVLSNRCLYLWEAVSDHLAQYLPTRVGTQLQRAVATHRFKDRVMRAEYLSILNEWTRQHRQFVMLKNQFLETTFFEQEFVKPMYDMDVLFNEPAEYWLLAKDLFKRGYHAKTEHRIGQLITTLSQLKKTPIVSQNLFEKNDAEMPVVQHCIELHPQVVDNFYYRAVPITATQNQQLTRVIFKTSQSQKIEGVSVQYPAPHYHLLVLILHSVVQHNAQGLVTLWEVAAYLTRTSDLDWAQFARLVKKYQLKPYVTWYFGLIEVLLPGSLSGYKNQAFQTLFSPTKYRPSRMKAPLLFWMMHKVFHHTDFIAGEWQERQKWLSWKIIEW